MRKQKAKKKGTKSKPRNRAPSACPDSPSDGSDRKPAWPGCGLPTWMERDLRWLPADCEDFDWDANDAEISHASKDPSRTDVSIITWNVLADSYCTRRSHPGLPMRSQNLVFDRHRRPDMVRRTLKFLHERLEPDMFALQEVDEPLEIGSRLRSLGYEGIESPTNPAGRDGRVDACCLYYKTDTWNRVEHEIIRLDDLASMEARAEGSDGDDDNKGSSRRGSVDGNLQGLQTSFLRRNVAVMARMEHKQTKKRVVVLVAHLFWNPMYEYVKLCQAHYILTRAQAFCGDQTPLIVCGDFNSNPGSNVHRYMVEGSVNAKMLAPWHNVAVPKEDITTVDPTATQADTNGSEAASLSMEETMNGLSMATDSSDTNAHGNGSASHSNTDKDVTDEIVKHGSNIRYLLDFTLNRLCRWLRILGIDAALETEAEEKLRTKQQKIEIFRRCHAEKRTLITTSSRLLARKDCPPGTYLLTTKSLSHLELAFPHILSSHGVKLFPRQFLSRCVVCNGHIRGVSDDQVQEIFSQHHAPIDQTLEKLDVFQCSGCGQGYWWCDQPTSSASRVKNQATKLLEYCIQGNVEIDEDMGMFDYVDVEALQNSNQTDDGDGPSRIAGPPLEVVRWLRQDALANPLGQLKSVYIKSDDPTKEVLQFTNLTSRFAGVLDYVMYLPGQLELQERLYVPLEKEDLNCQGIHNGHLLPSFVWPSDHLALGARFSFVNDNDGEQGDSEAQDEKNDSKESSAVTIEPQLDTESSAMVQILKQAVKTDDFLFCAPVGGEITVPPPVTTIPKLFKQPLASSGQNKDDHDDHPETEDHGDKCACGCVPDVLSLFEMAKLRKEARERRKARAEGAAGIA